MIRAGRVPDNPLAGERFRDAAMVRRSGVIRHYRSDSVPTTAEWVRID